MAQIILIEDNPQTARMVIRLLSKRGHIVEAFSSGEEGLTRLLEIVPSLILIDLGLPDIDGQTVIAIIHQQLALNATPVVAFTAWPLEVAQNMAKAYGCDGIITKPIDTRRFGQQVEEFFRESTLEDKRV